MSLFTLYLLLLKATITTFNGPSSLPVLRHDFVVARQVLTDRDLNAAVTAGRLSPGPMGIYVVSVGYLIAGVPGASVAMLALMTPSLLIVPLIRFLGRRVEDERIRRSLNAVVLAGSGLVLASALPLARDAITGPLSACLAVAGLLFTIRR